jgi:hypothetical protein
LGNKKSRESDIGFRITGVIYVENFPGFNKIVSKKIIGKINFTKSVELCSLL